MFVGEGGAHLGLIYLFISLVNAHEALAYKNNYDGMLEIYLYKTFWITLEIEKKNTKPQLRIFHESNWQLFRSLTIVIVGENVPEVTGYLPY